MPKKLNIRLVKTRESYTTRQLASLLGVHIRTIHKWKKLGLKPISDSSPYLFMGVIVKEYLKQKHDNKKTTLDCNQFYCVKCRCAACSVDNQINIRKTGKKLGKEGNDEFSLKGICELCGCVLNRYSHAGKLEEIQRIFRVENLSEFDLS